jgi:hypothetical protein
MEHTMQDVVDMVRAMRRDWPEQMEFIGVVVEFDNQFGTEIFGITREGELEWQFGTPAELVAFLIGMEHALFTEKRKESFDLGVTRGRKIVDSQSI